MSAPLIANRLARQLKWEELDPVALRKLIEFARKEDLEGWGLARRPEQSGDISSRLLPLPNKPSSARLVAREQLVVAGLGLVPLILEAYGEGATFSAVLADGTSCAPGQCMGTLAGPAQTLLEAERVLLNFLQRLSGVATHTRGYVDALGDCQTRLLDTRKTTPGFRVLEKYAVACGGGFNHRLGLFDRVMLKDNHLAAAQASSGRALSELISASLEKWPDMIIQLEVDSLEQIPPALEAGIQNLLLDNFSNKDLQQAVSLVGDRAATEASGGITRDRLSSIANVGLDFISTGATVHQAPWKDIGLDWDPR